MHAYVHKPGVYRTASKITILAYNTCIGSCNVNSKLSYNLQYAYTRDTSLKKKKKKIDWYRSSPVLSIHIHKRNYAAAARYSLPKPQLIALQTPGIQAATCVYITAMHKRRSHCSRIMIRLHLIRGTARAWKSAAATAREECRRVQFGKNRLGWPCGRPPLPFFLFFSCGGLYSHARAYTVFCARGLFLVAWNY